MSVSEFCVLKCLGFGTFGSCKKVRRKSDGAVFAWKEIDYSQFSETELHMLCQEVNLLRTLKHENIVAYSGRIVDSAKSTLFIVMEFCDNGDLAGLVSAFGRAQELLTHLLVPEQFVWRVLLQLLQALEFCHSGGIDGGTMVVHRDLKPANVLLDGNWNVKLGDFGLSRLLSSVQSLATTFVGTPMYMSPELLCDGYTNPKSDIWALGCVLHELMALRPPFNASSEHELKRLISTGCTTQLPIKFSPSLRNLTKNLLTLNALHRPSAKELLDKPEVRRRRHENLEQSWPEILKKILSSQSANSCRDQPISEAEISELLLLQGRLEKKDRDLQLKQLQLQDLEQQVQEQKQRNDAQQVRLTNLEQRLAAWEKKLKELNESLQRKQNILAQTESMQNASAAVKRKRRPGLAAQPPNISPIVAMAIHNNRKLQPSPSLGSYCVNTPTATATQKLDGTYEPKINLRDAATCAAGDAAAVKLIDRKAQKK